MTKSRVFPTITDSRPSDDVAIAEYLASLVAEGKLRKTVHSYGRSIARLQAWAPNSLLDLTATEVGAWCAERRASAGLATCEMDRLVANRFRMFAASRGWIEGQPFTLIRTASGELVGKLEAATRPAEHAVARFLDYLRERGLTEERIRARRRPLSRLATWAERPLLELSTDDLSQWWERRGAELEGSAKRDERTAVTAFYGWALEAQLLSADPTTRVAGLRYDRRRRRPNPGLPPCYGPPTIVEAWRAWMAVSGNAAETIRSRGDALRGLERSHGPLMALTRNDLIDYLARFPRASTRASMRSYVRCFYAWACDEGYLTDDPSRRLPKVSVPRGVPRPIPTDELERLLTSAPARVRLWAELMAYAGLRIAEVAACRPEHVWQRGPESWWLRIPRSKGGHDQQVPLPQWLAHKLSAAERWEVGVLVIRRHMTAALRPAGSQATPHQLRHWYATMALQSTGNLRVVQELMRHASPTSTARYTFISSNEATVAVERFPRLGEQGLTVVELPAVPV
jgi:integrase/recombinase XerD